MLVDANINDILSGSDIYKYVEQLHRNKDDFFEGDLGERIWSKLLYIPISDIIIDEYEIDTDYVDEYINKYKETNNYPPIVLDRDISYNYKNKYKNKYSIIDGNHRTNSLNDSGVKLVKAWVSQ